MAEQRIEFSSQKNVEIEIESSQAVDREVAKEVKLLDAQWK